MLLDILFAQVRYYLNKQILQILQHMKDLTFHERFTSFNGDERELEIKH